MRWGSSEVHRSSLRDAAHYTRPVVIFARRVVTGRSFTPLDRSPAACIALSVARGPQLLSLAFASLRPLDLGSASRSITSPAFKVFG